MVQQNAAGSLRVSLNSPLFSLPPRLGARGLKRASGQHWSEHGEWVLMGTAHPCSWIPASAGMTRVAPGCAEGQGSFAEGLGVSPNLTTIPQEWGVKGVDHHVSLHPEEIILVMQRLRRSRYNSCSRW